jgi:hypothetical protein
MFSGLILVLPKVFVSEDYGLRWRVSLHQSDSDGETNLRVRAQQKLASPLKTALEVHETAFEVYGVVLLDSEVHCQRATVWPGRPHFTTWDLRESMATRFSSPNYSVAGGHSPTPAGEPD